MIDYINHQLNRWASWTSTGRSRLGYPNHAAFVQLPGSSRAAALPDDQGMVIEHAIVALEPELRALVHRYYRTMSSCPAEQIAQDLGIHRDTLYARLHRVHLKVKEYIEDREIEQGEQSQRYRATVW